MNPFKRNIWSLFLAVLLSWDPQAWAVLADPDVPNPPANIESIRGCSLIIPMGYALQTAGTTTPAADGTTFNMKACVFWLWSGCLGLGLSC